MKKYLLSLFICFLTIGVKAQDDLDLVSEPFEYKKVLEFSSPKEQKHLQAKEWVAKTFGDYKSVLQFEDDSNCKMIIKGKFNLPSEKSVSKFFNSTDEFSAKFTLTIDSKEDKYRVVFDNFTIEEQSSTSILGGRPSRKTNNLSIKEYCEFDTLGQIATIEKNKIHLDSLQNIDVQTLKKKQLKEHEGQIENWKFQVSASLDYYQRRMSRGVSIRETLQKLLASIREAVESTDDF